MPARSRGTSPTRVLSTTGPHPTGTRRRERGQPKQRLVVTVDPLVAMPMRFVGRAGPLGPPVWVGVAVPTDAIADGDIGDHLSRVGCALAAQRWDQAPKLHARSPTRAGPVGQQ